MQSRPAANINVGLDQYMGAIQYRSSPALRGRRAGLGADPAATIRRAHTARKFQQDQHRCCALQRAWSPPR